jgi:hypothetical protein
MKMKKSEKVACIAFLFCIAIFLAPGTAHANIIDCGDFESPCDITSGTFTAGGGTSDELEWYSTDKWSIQAGGPSGGAAYADHAINDVKLFQGIELSPGEVPSGTTLNLSFDWIFNVEAPVQGTSWFDVAVFGLTSGDSLGIFAPNDFPGTELLLERLASIDPSEAPTSNDWTHASFDVDVTGDFDALLLGFQMQAWYSGQSEIGGLRGVDNVVLSAVPEPATMLLLGFGLVGLGAARRRLQ